MIKYAKNVVYYGYNYRKYYEKQIKDNGKITTKAHMSDPLAVACFLGVAALSG
ncbi:unnamed protein product, partial [marine sediment metagenome]